MDDSGGSSAAYWKKSRTDSKKEGEKMIAFYGIKLKNGKTLEGKKIGELVEEIIYKFSEAGLSCTEAKIVLEKTADVLGEFSRVQKVT